MTLGLTLNASAWMGRSIPYVGRSALIRNKKSAGRYKDLADVEELERGES